MTKDEHIAELESCIREIWGAMLLADSVVTDPKVKAAFLRVHHRCEATGLMHRVGMRFVETA